MRLSFVFRIMRRVRNQCGAKTSTMPDCAQMRFHKPKPKYAVAVEFIAISSLKRARIGRKIPNDSKRNGLPPLSSYSRALRPEPTHHRFIRNLFIYVCLVKQRPIFPPVHPLRLIREILRQAPRSAQPYSNVLGAA